MPRYYCIREEDSSHGSEPVDILLQHFKSDDFKTYVIRKEDWAGWSICNALNNAYEAGRADAMRDLRNFIGVEK